MRLATLLFLIVAALGLSSCAGSRSQELALLPPTQAAWPAVREDFERGVAVGVETEQLAPPAADALRGFADELGRGLDAGDLATIRAQRWPMIEHWTEVGIADKLRAGLIGPGVAESLRERLRNFSESVRRLQEQR